MHWSVVVLILGLLAIIVYLSLRPQPEDSAGEAEHADGKKGPKIRVTLARGKPGSEVTLSQLMSEVRAPFPASARPAASNEMMAQSLKKLEQALAERERLMSEQESRLAELERELAEREALLLARERLLAAREK